MEAKKIVFVKKVAKSAGKLLIIIPKELEEEVDRRKYYKITMKPIT